FDVEEANLPEIEKPLVKTSPDVHPPAMDVVREVIDVIEPCTCGLRVTIAKPIELRFVGRALRTIAIDEIQQTTADSPDCWSVRCLWGRGTLGGFRAEGGRAVVGAPGIDDAERHRWGARSMGCNEVETVGARLFVDEVVDVALPIDRDLPRFVTRDRRKAHQ